METGAGPVELLIGLDNRQWLPIHIEDSWDPDDDMRLMKSAFGHRFMITDGWGRSRGTRRGAGRGSRRPGWWPGRDPGSPATRISWQEPEHMEPRQWGSTRDPGTWEPGPKCRRPGEDGSQEAVAPKGEDDSCSRAEGSPRSPARPRETPRPKRAATCPPSASGAARLAAGRGWVTSMLPDLSRCEGSRALTPEECPAYSNRPGQLTPCRGWPS
jgi:hypothetical protein